MVDETARIRRCRELFERALAANVSIEAVREREMAERWAHADRRLQDRRCGTRAAVPIAEIAAEDEGRALQWWQK